MIRLLTHLRSAIGVVLMSLFTGFCSFAVFASGFAGHKKAADFFMRFWAHGVLVFFGVTVLVEGEENLPDRGGGIIAFNHQSHFDIPALFASTSKSIRFGAKIELFRIPLFGAAMRAVGTLPIAREKRGETMKVYEEAAARFAENTLFVLAPEGTRQARPEIGSFKRGPFIFAASAGVPVIPAVIKGAFAVCPKGSLSVNVGQWRRQIHIRFLPPIVSHGNENRQAIETLVSGVREAMVGAYQAMPSDV